MDDHDDKPQPASEQTALLRRIAAAVEKAGPPRGPSMPPASMGAGKDKADISVPKREYANAGNIDIEPPKGQREPSVFGKAAISLQNWSNLAADYGVQSPTLHSLTSMAKVASRYAGDQHTRGEALAKRGLRPNTGGDSESILRSIEINTKRKEGQGDSAGDQQSNIAQNDLKDSIDSLKEAIDDLKDVVKESGSQRQGGGSGPRMPQQASPPPQGGKMRTARAGPMGSGSNLQAIQSLKAAFSL